MVRDLTVVLTHYKRPQQIIQVAAALKRQTLVPELVVWDNDCSLPTLANADLHVASSRNLGCYPRWWLAANAQTPWVLVMDDDLVPIDREVLADTVRELERLSLRAVGAYGVVLEPGKTYHQCVHYGERRARGHDVDVTVIKGRYFAVATERLAALPAKIEGEDDMAVSAFLGGGILPGKLCRRLRDLPTGPEALHRRPDHWERRETARRRFFQNTYVQARSDGI